MNPLDKLDAVLNLFDFNDEYYGIHGIDIKKRLSERKISFEDNLFNEILDKLIKDGYLRRITKDALFNGQVINDIYHYLLTFEGWIFKENGGYVKDFYRQEMKIQIQMKNQKRQVQRDWLVIFGSLIAGIGTVSLAVIELLKHFCWN